MNTAVKVLIGLILIIIGFALFADTDGSPIMGTSKWFPGDWLGNFVVVLTGFIPPMIILFGLFIVWLEIDEIKAERELEKEEKEEAEKEKKKEEKK